MLSVVLLSVVCCLFVVNWLLFVAFLRCCSLFVVRRVLFVA